MKLDPTSIIATLLLLAATLQIGCNQKEPQGEITGKVTHNGEVVSQGYVILRNRAKGVHMMVEIQKDGTFRASTAEGYGLPLGEYIVYLSPPVPDVPFGPASAPPDPNEVVKFPEKYLKPETSELTIALDEAGSTLNIDMVD